MHFREKNNHQNSNISLAKQQEGKVKVGALLASVGVAVAVAIGVSQCTWEKIKETATVAEGKNRWEPLREIRSNILDWQKYAWNVAGVICSDCDSQEKKNFQNIFLALIAHESKYNPQAVSETGARGLGQLTSVVNEDFQQKHRSRLYWREIVKIRDNHPELLRDLPRSVIEQIVALPKKPTQEQIVELSETMDFYARSSVITHQDAKLDPHTNILLSAIVFRIKYNESKYDNKTAKTYKLLQKRLSGTEYQLPSNIKYTGNMQKAMYALRHYNGDQAKTDVDGVQQRDKYVYKVLKEYQNETARKMALEYKKKHPKKPKENAVIKNP